MRQGRRSFRTAVVVAVSLALVIGAAFSASASHGKDGDPLSEVPDLFPDGASYGTLRDHDDSTEPNGKEAESGCSSGSKEGGSVYKLSAKIATKITLDVTDDIAGSSLTCVGLYREHLQGDTLPALYGFPDLEDYEVHADNCNNYNSVCRMKWVVPETDNYYMVFWPNCCYGPDSNANYATFRFTVSVRQPTRTKLAIDGASKTPSGECFNVEGRGSVTATVQVTHEATGEVKFKLDRKQKGKWKLISTSDVALADSKASHKQSFNKDGQYRLRAQYLGDDARAPSKSRKACIQVTG